MSHMYAWANMVEAKFGMGPLIGDHTWVTTYEPGIGSPDPTRGDYWYCWGNERALAENLVKGIGGAEFARRIAQPNNKDETVGIKHKFDGVCHQMANRLLRFSMDENDKPVTVHQAKGYHLSKAMYGVYGSDTIGGLSKWNALVENYQKEMDKEKKCPTTKTAE